MHCATAKQTVTVSSASLNLYLTVCPHESILTSIECSMQRFYQLQCVLQVNYLQSNDIINCSQHTAQTEVRVLYTEL